MTAAWRRSIPLLALLALGGGGALAGALLEPRSAPEWQIAEWVNDDPGPLAAQRGRIVVIEFFQLWCPGCHAFSLPLFERWAERYGGRDDVLVVSIHSVFEGHELQSPALLREFVRERGIGRPVGIDAPAADGGDVPVSMERFGAEGTPHVVIVDREGQIVYSHFGAFEPGPVEAFIDRLLKKKPGTADKTPARSRGRTLRAGQAARPPTAAPAPTPQGTLRERGRRNPPRRPPGEGTDGPSGSYRVDFQQTEKSCGSPIQSMQLIVDLVESDGALDVRVRRPFLGLHRFSATYDETNGEFRASETASVKERGQDVEFSLELVGSLDPAADPPTLSYEFTVEKAGPTAGWACTIRGGGAGVKLAR